MRAATLIVCSWLFATLLTPSFSQAQVWEDTNSWNEAWETEFSRWVEANWTIDFFAKKTLANGEPNPYYGLRVDCADTVYSMRIIFAAAHSLPFVIKDPTTHNRLISNRMSRWNHLNTSAERMRQFLRFIYNVVSTQSLPNDTYPPPITRNFIRGGALIRTTQVNHHSWSLKKMFATGVPYLVFNSTVTAASTLTLQERDSWPNPYWFFEGDYSPASNAGFRTWRPEQYLLSPVWEVPNYSEEQFKFPLGQWVKHVQRKLALRHEGDDEKLNRLFRTACEAGKNRVEAVNDGIKVLRALPFQCMDFATYDQVSTPKRDQRFFDDLAELRRSYKDIMKTNGGSQLSPNLKSELARIFPFYAQSARSETQSMRPSSGRGACVINYAPGKSIDLAEAKRRMFAGLISNNPMDEMSYRWGEIAGPSSRAAACESWDVWKPDLRQAD